MKLPDFFAIDIGNHSIKVAEVKRSGESNAELLRIGSAPADSSVLDNTTEDGLKKLAEQIKSARSQAGISTTNCVAAVPETPIFSRLLSIPKVENTDMEETVHWELKPLIPVPLEEVDIAFLEINERKLGDQIMVDIYVVAAPKTLTNRYKRLAEFAGLNLLALETESLANTRAITFNQKTERDIMILDFGALSTDLIIARDSVPVFAQSISTGSDALTKAISADYGLTVDEAEKYKRSFGLRFDQGEGKIARSIEPIMQIVINEMSRTFTYFKEKIGDSNATKIYMCGEAAGLPGLGEYLGGKLGLETTLVDPTAKLKVSGSVKTQLTKTPSVGFSVAIGLALKDS